MFRLLSTDGGTAIYKNTSVTFLDEFRMMGLTPQITPDDLEFTSFDTFVPHGHPVNSRQFLLPPRCHGWTPSVHVDGDRCLGTLDRGGPLTTDPTQAVLVVKLARPRAVPVLLVVRVQTLIEHVRSASTDACVPWDVWARDAAVMEVPTRGSTRDGPFPLVRGVHVILIKVYDTPGADGSHLPHPLLYTFDFSRRGCSLLPLWGEGGGTERRVLFEDGQQSVLQRDEWVAERTLNPLGDGGFMHLVSCFHRWKRGCRLTLYQEKFLRSRGYVTRLGADLSGSIAPPRVARTSVCTAGRLSFRTNSTPTQHGGSIISRGV